MGEKEESTKYLLSEVATGNLDDRDCFREKEATDATLVTKDMENSVTILKQERRISTFRGSCEGSQITADKGNRAETGENAEAEHGNTTKQSQRDQRRWLLLPNITQCWRISLGTTWQTLK